MQLLFLPWSVICRLHVARSRVFRDDKSCLIRYRPLRGRIKNPFPHGCGQNWCKSSFVSLGVRLVLEPPSDLPRMEPPAALEVSIEASATAPPDSRALVEACFQIQDRDVLLRSLDVVLGSNMVDGAISIFEITNGGTPKIFKTQGPSRTLTFVKGHGPHQFYLCILRDNWCEYCSCRSFLERSRKNEPYCKHLLALKLYPLLLLDNDGAAAAVVRVETFTDEAIFRAVVLPRLFPHQPPPRQQQPHQQQHDVGTAGV
jgi:hypothetical protein